MKSGDSVLTTREIALHVKGIIPAATAILHIHVEEHVGGSHYMQAYRVRPVNNDAATVGLIPTATYCLKVYHAHPNWMCPGDTFMKMLVPRRRVLEMLDRVGRMGALWQTVVRAAATAAMGRDTVVPKVLATFYDQNLRAFGTIEEWIGGRPWRLEMDDQLFDRTHPSDDPDIQEERRFTSEYTAKRFFLARIARVMREVGADGLADRYAWRNWRSPRRAVLREGSTDPYAGLTAVDFEPARGDTGKLHNCLEQYPEVFADVRWAADELIELSKAEPAPADETSAVMPRANPAIAHLLWLWSKDRPDGLIHRLRSAWHRLAHGMRMMVRLVRRADLRAAWLLEQVEDGLAEGRLSEAEAEAIRGQVNDPYVQVYLKCLFVHICTLPVTNLAVLFGGTAYALWNHLALREGIQLVVAWLAVFAIIPISPGSIVRGLYVAWVVWRRRELKRFRIALLLSFWRYVGFLAFPLQMVRTFPALSRFAAALWATNAVHMIPFYGKRGSMLEHKVFDLFFNIPISVARILRERRKQDG